MGPLFKHAAAAAVLLNSGLVTAQEVTGTIRSSTYTPIPTSTATACRSALAPGYSRPVVAEGWKAQLIATGLDNPRGIKFDSNGGLLVIEARTGLRRLTFDDNGGTCLEVRESTSLIEDEELNHGLELSEDGRTLYVSTDDEVQRYDYDPDTHTVGNMTTIVDGMAHDGPGHVSRTLLLSRKEPDLLLVSRGSEGNLDWAANDQTTGVSQIRAFNVTFHAAADVSQPFNYPSDGFLLGWGLRNSVGVAEHPVTGGIYSVENSADDIHRLDEDIHEDNPGEELNFHGFLNDTDSPRGDNNFGYPACFALWNTTDFPQQGDLTVGDQFSLSNNATLNDTTCAERTVSPRLTFQAHTAPLDIKFSPSDGGSRAFISFHGSWNRDHPAGYKLSYVEFNSETGEPTEPSDSVTAVRDILTAPDVAACDNQGGCFRPVGLAFDASGERLFVSSDATGEIWVVVRDGEEDSGNGGGNGGGNGNGNGGSGSGSPTETNAPEETTSTAAAVPGVMYRGVGGPAWMVVVVTAVMVAVGGLTFVA